MRPAERAVNLLLALLSSLLWGTSDFLGGTISRRLSAQVVVAGSQALALLVLVPVVGVLRAWEAPAGYLPWALAAGAAGLLGLVAFYTALAAGTMGVVAPIAATGVVVPVLVGLARGDAPTLLQALGMAAASGGVILASGPERSGSAGRTARRPLVLAAIAALGFGAALVCLAEGARSSVLMTLVTMRIETVGMLAVLIGLRRTRRRDLLGVRRRDLLGVRRRDLLVLAFIGWADAGANGTYALATRSGALSVVAVLGSLYPAVTVVLAREVHGERLRPVQTGGVTMALVGVVLLAAGGAG